jgi:predicted DNA binding protein
MIEDNQLKSDTLTSRLPADNISQRILTIRGHSVILDSDLAALYRVTTRALNQAVKRNAGRFPEDFAFRITTKEKEEVVTKCDHLSRLKFSPVLSFAYTEHGTIMAATVLNSQRAVETSVFVVRAFVRMREAMASHRELAHRLNTLEKRYDARFRVVFDAIRALMEPPKAPRRRIGF